MKNILFICTYNLQRSPTAEELINNNPKYNKKYRAKSAGISSLSEKLVTKQAIGWSDIIFVMEDIHKKFLLENFPESKHKKIIVLDIPDIYLKNNSELIKILHEKFKKYL